MPTVNGHTVEPGCWVDGHWGQYAPDRLADQAETLGWTPAHPETDDPRTIRRIVELIETWGYPRDHTDMRSEAVNIIASLWATHIESADDILDWLNDHTVPQYLGSRFVNELVLDRRGVDTTTPGDKAMETEEVWQTYSWGWSDGEVFLWTTEQWEEES